MARKKKTDNWLKECEICNAGLCATIDGLKSEGKSERGACKDLSEQSKGLYTGIEILTRYRYNSGKDKKSVRNSDKVSVGIEVFKLRDEGFTRKEMFEFVGRSDLYKKDVQIEDLFNVPVVEVKEWKDTDILVIGGKGEKHVDVIKYTEEHEEPTKMDVDIVTTDSKEPAKIDVIARKPKPAIDEYAESITRRMDHLTKGLHQVQVKDVRSNKIRNEMLGAGKMLKKAITKLERQWKHEQDKKEKQKVKKVSYLLGKR